MRGPNVGESRSNSATPPPGTENTMVGTRSGIAVGNGRVVGVGNAAPKLMPTMEPSDWPIKAMRAGSMSPTVSLSRSSDGNARVSASRLTTPWRRLSRLARGYGRLMK